MEYLFIEFAVYIFVCFIFIRIDTVIFDKTGTLTEGKPAVTDIVILKAQRKGKLILFAESLQYRAYSQVL